MSGVTSNKAGVRIVVVGLVLVFLGLAFCERSEAQSVYGELQHASTGGATEYNAGRNYLLAGIRTDSGLSVGFGRFLVGSSACAYAMSIGQSLADGRWQASLTTHGDVSCRRNGEDLEDRGNVGACVTRMAGGRFAIGFGVCIWQRGDIAVHKEPINRSDNDDLQLTASIVLRIGRR